MTKDKKPESSGAVVRVKSRSVSGDEDTDESAGRAGETYEVYDFVPAGHKHNDDPGGRAYYILDDEYSTGGSHWAYPEDVETAMTAKAAAEREVPSIAETSKAVMSGLMSLMNDGMEFTEAQVEGEGDKSYVVAHGKADNGLAIGVRVAVLEVWREDY